MNLINLNPNTNPPVDESLLEKFRGCLLGGAVGDALGSAVEFDSLERIRSRFGPNGITDYAEAYGRIGAVTDDTQLTLFTAEGVLRAAENSTKPTVFESHLYHAYLRWEHTQRIRIPNDDRVFPDYLQGSRLLYHPDMNHRRSPGRTCLTALRSGRMGTVENPINNSKGCGGVMRVAPIGLTADYESVFDLAIKSAAITHGHPSGYLSAGVFALIINLLVRGYNLQSAVEHACFDILPNYRGHEETLNAVKEAIQLFQNKRIFPSPEVIETLGGGWTGEEALSIALYCAYASLGEFEKGILLAVNHSGDTDSVGSLTGNLLGVILGVNAIPEKWLDRLELNGVLRDFSEDLVHIVDIAKDD